MKQIFLLLFSSIFLNFGIPEPIQKKIDKEIISIFEIDSFSKTPIPIDEELNSELLVPIGPENFYKIFYEDNLLGYFYYGKALGKVDDFDYLVVFDDHMILKKIKILAYREDYGGEISSKRWLKQFIGLTNHNRIEYSKDIKAISGATISARSMTNSINDLLKSLSILQNKKQL